MVLEPDMTTWLARLNWLWRLLMTGLCFVLFGLGGLLLSLVWFNLLLLCLRDGLQRRRVARRSIAISFRFFLRSARLLRVLDYRILGVEKLAADRGCLIIANHPTLIDYVLIASVMPETDCLVKGTLLSNPFVRGVIRSAGYLINSQADSLLPDCQERLARGDTILIFPEGTRSRQGKPMILQRGAANIAVRCKCDLRVVQIRCSQHLLDKQSHWYNVPPEKPLFQIDVCERVSPHPFRHQAIDEPSRAARQLNRHLLERLTIPNNSLAGMEDARAIS